VYDFQSNLFFLELWGRLGFAQEIFPRTPQCTLDTHESGVQNIHLAGFNLLDSSRMKPNHFREAFLGNVLINPFPADVDSQSSQLHRLDTF
jgi:hypothetical protein